MSKKCTTTTTKDLDTGRTKNSDKQGNKENVYLTLAIKKGSKIIFTMQPYSFNITENIPTKGILSVCIKNRQILPKSCLGVKGIGNSYQRVVWA